MAQLNKLLIVPLASIIVLLVKEIFGIELPQGEIESLLTFTLLALSGTGIFMQPKKQCSCEKKEE